MKTPRGVSLLLLLCVAGCSDRDHNNPFDPDNPSTHGRPLELWALSSTNYVRLHWSIPPHTDIDPAVILRIRSTDDADTVLGALTGNGTWVDRPVTPGSVLSYLLVATVPGWNGIHTSDTSSVVPSPGSCWVASGYDRITLVSPRSSSLFPSVAPGTFIVDATASGPSLWAAGMPGGMVYRVEAYPEASTVSVREELPTSLALRSISASGSTSRILLGHAEGLTWLDPAASSLSRWAVALAAPRLVRLAPDEPGAWVWTEGDTLAYVVPGASSPVARWSQTGIEVLVPVPGRACWVGGRAGLALATIDGVHTVLSAAVTSAAADRADSCVACRDSDGAVILVTANGVVHAALNLNASGMCLAPGDAAIWVITRGTTLWKLFTDLAVAARVELREEPWVVLPGPASLR